MTAGGGASGPGDRVRLRRWLEHVAQSAIDWLDELDAEGEDREDDEREICCEDDGSRGRESNSHRGRP